MRNTGIRRFLKNIEIWGRLRILDVLRLLFASRIKYDRIEKSELKGRILFIRPDRLGDVIISTPVFRILKEKEPKVEITVLASNRNKNIVKKLPYVDRIVLYHKNPLLFFLSLFRVLLTGYDFAVDLMDIPSVTSSVYLIFSRARYRLGFSQKPGGYNVNFIYNVRVPLMIKEKTHIIERTAQVLKPFGIDFSLQDLRPDFPLTDEDLKFGERFISMIGWEGKIVGINISAGKSTRWWGEENYIELAKGITRRGYRVLLLTHLDDIERANTIIGGVGNMIRLGPVTGDFSKFASVLRWLYILVTPDTSVVHIASAFNIPVVGLYPADYQNLVSWRPYLVPNRVVQSPVKDELHHIKVEWVLDAFDSLVDELQSKGQNL